jgi:hypothetical protein
MLHQYDFNIYERKEFARGGKKLFNFWEQVKKNEESST